QTDLLHGGAVGEELHFHRMLLAYAPRAPAGLPQSVQRIAGFVEEDGRKLQQIESGLNQLGMADNDVDPALQLLAVPGLPFMGGHAGAEHTGANPLGSQQLLQPCRYVVLVGVDGKDLAFTSTVELPLDLLNESSFLGINLALIQILRFGDDEALALLGFGVVAGGGKRGPTAGVGGGDP